MGKPTIFISYSHEDEAWKDRLMKHLGVPVRQGLLDVWVDRKMEAGVDWFKEIERALDKAAAAILVITTDFLNSRFILDQEVPRLLEKRIEQGVRIFPLIAKPCDWESVEWLRRMNLRPRDGKPLSTVAESEIDIALTAFVKEIRQLLTSAAPTAPGSSRISFPPEKTFTDKLPVTGKDLFGREQETAILDDAWNDAQTSIISLVAFGGVGKSALVNHWLNRMGEDNFRGAAWGGENHPFM